MAFRNYLEGEDDKPYFHLNSLAHYYEEMERYAALIKEMTGYIKAYDKTLTLTIEDIEKQITKRMSEWDEKLKNFDGSVTHLLEKWVTDGTLELILEDALLDKKAEKVEVDLLAVKLIEEGNKSAGSISILHFEELVIDKGLVTEDWKNAFLAARNLLAQSTLKKRLVFPSGIYPYSVSPNWNISNSVIEADGEVRLRYTGTENAVIMDAGEVNGLTWNMKFDGFFIEAPATAKNALFVRGVHASHIKAKVLGAGTLYAGLRVEWCVCTDFYITVSVNHETWYKGAKPKYGIFLDKKELQPSGLGGYTSWCSFYTPKIEGTVIGIHIERGQGNSFYSGTSEACSQTGVVLSPFSLYNKFFGLDMEANVNYDIYCMGKENEFYSVDSTGIHLFDGTAKDNVMIGGSQNSIILNEQTKGNTFQNVKYNRFNNGATLNDKSGKNRLMSNRNVGMDRTENRPPASSEILVTESPFTYVNNSGNDEMVHIVGGIVTTFQYIHAGFGDTTNVNPQFIRLCVGDSLKIVYTVPPKLRKYTT